ncbi:DUF3037 domain-containing protein [Flavobacterium alkalisoli]|uniref:DUF3037 domain-containing protein n=1 Tax=Flavobacterium alkalisoli TaxID=2602769 RepID=UPI003A8D4D56
MKTDFCTYCILKYKHSPYLDESINIGVLIFYASTQKFSFKYSRNLSRVKSIYENIPEKTIKEYLRQIDNRLNKFHSTDKDIFPLNDLELKDFLSKNILSSDSTILQFSNFKTIKKGKFEESYIENIILQQNFVDDIKHIPYSPQEPKIISNLYRELNKFGLKDVKNNNRFKEDYSITTKNGAKFSFEFAWKNGLWNLVKPVGFDLKTSDGIIEKAHKNLGQFTDLESENSNYKYNLIVGKPSSKKLYKSYDSALNILEKLKYTEIVEEKDISKYSINVIEHIKDEISN